MKIFSSILCSLVLCISTAGNGQWLENEMRAAAVNPDLVTPAPVENAKRLYDFLKDTYRKNILSGVMTLASMDEVNWLKANTGKEPVVLGLDFMHCNRGYTWYNDEEPVNDARAYYNRNGIPIFAWHWRDPLRTTEEFYTNSTTFDVSKINDPSSPEYAAMISDIDYISNLLKPLNDDGIPVMWRPLHEAAGGWFWWGAKGPQPCKKLFQVMFERMVYHHGLKNLIWVWTREPNDNDWYPGDEYVDIVGRDLYKDGDHSSQINEYNTMVNMYDGKKMIGLSETGSFPDVDNLVKDKAGWLWYMPWYGKYTRDATYNPLALWKKMFAHTYVITLDEMPDLKTYVSAGPVTGIEYNGEDRALKISPSFVTNNRFTVENDSPIGAIIISDYTGRELRRYPVTDSKTTICPGLESGMYLIKSTLTGRVARIVVY